MSPVTEAKEANAAWEREEEEADWDKEGKDNNKPDPLGKESLIAD